MSLSSTKVMLENDKIELGGPSDNALCEFNTLHRAVFIAILGHRLLSSLAAGTARVPAIKASGFIHTQDEGKAWEGLDTCQCTNTVCLSAFPLLADPQASSC